MIEVIVSLFDSVTNKLIGAKKVQFADNDTGRLSVMWTIRGNEGLGYGESICRDLPIVNRKAAPDEGVKTKVDWVP